jgi:hypothetical protein
MDQPTTIGVDLAKVVFAVCVLDATGAVLPRRVLRREAFMRWAEQCFHCNGRSFFRGASGRSSVRTIAQRRQRPLSACQLPRPDSVSAKH